MSNEDNNEGMGEDLPYQGADSDIGDERREPLTFDEYMTQHEDIDIEEDHATAHPQVESILCQSEIIDTVITGAENVAAIYMTDRRIILHKYRSTGQAGVITDISYDHISSFNYTSSSKPIYFIVGVIIILIGFYVIGESIEMFLLNISVCAMLFLFYFNSISIGLHIFVIGVQNPYVIVGNKKMGIGMEQFRDIIKIARHYSNLTKVSE